MPSLLPTVTATPAGPAVFTSPRYDYTVTLPCCWLALPTPGLAAAAALTELQPTPTATGEDTAATSLTPGFLAETLELVALLPDTARSGAPLAQLTVSVLPSAGLTLEQYRAAATAELAALHQTQVQASRLDATLHPERLPAAVIEYITAAQTPVAGMQVAFFLDDPAYLLVMTFTTDAPRLVDLAPRFGEIVRQVRLARPV
jgi:hypothetical protein